MLRNLKIDDGGFFRRWDAGGHFSERTVVFGRNGSGKSTIARHLGLADSGAPEASQVVIEADPSVEFLVFDRRYVAENVVGVAGTGELSRALFVTGTERVEIEQQVQALSERQARVDRLIGISERHASRGDVSLTVEVAAGDGPVVHAAILV